VLKDELVSEDELSCLNMLGVSLRGTGDCTPLNGLDLGGGVGAVGPPVGVVVAGGRPPMLCLCLMGSAGGRLSLVVVGLCRRSAASVELGVVAELVLLVGDIRSEVGDDVERKSRSSRLPLDCALLKEILMNKTHVLMRLGKLSAINSDLYQEMEKIIYWLRSRTYLYEKKN
jgi:hypothetical protein